jgi:fibronectin type 3 domain-containing protein
MKVIRIIRVISGCLCLQLFVSAGASANLRRFDPPASSLSGAPAPVIRKFDFGPGALAKGYQRVMPQNIYSREAGFGFEPGTQIACTDRGGKDSLRSDFCTSDKPFYFSVALPEGNYTVTVTLGDAGGRSVTTVKAELRRLMIERVETEAGKFETRTFTVNVRTPQIATGA